MNSVTSTYISSVNSSVFLLEFFDSNFKNEVSKDVKEGFIDNFR